MCEGKCELPDPEVNSSGKTRAWRYAAVVIPGINLFAIAVIVEQGSGHRHSLKVQVEPAESKVTFRYTFGVGGCSYPGKGALMDVKCFVYQ